MNGTFIEKNEKSRNLMCTIKNLCKSNQVLVILTDFRKSVDSNQILIKYSDVKQFLEEVKQVVCSN